VTATTPVQNVVQIPYAQLPSSQADMNEYGYGYFFRYLTHYPGRMWTGKDQAWYFMSRLANSNVYGDLGFGDRILAVF
jgi:hypothetical protein